MSTRKTCHGAALCRSISRPKSYGARQYVEGGAWCEAGRGGARIERVGGEVSALGGRLWIVGLLHMPLRRRLHDNGTDRHHSDKRCGDVVAEYGLKLTLRQENRNLLQRPTVEIQKGNCRDVLVGAEASRKRSGGGATK